MVLQNPKNLQCTKKATKIKISRNKKDFFAFINLIKLVEFNLLKTIFKHKSSFKRFHEMFQLFEELTRKHPEADFRQNFKFICQKKVLVC